MASKSWMLGAHAEGEVDQGLGLVFGGVLLGVGVQDGALGLAGGGQGDLVDRVLAAEQPGDDGILAFIDRAGRALAAHGAVHGFDGELAGMGGGKGFPGRDFALAGLAGGEADMHGLLHGLVDDVLL